MAHFLWQQNSWFLLVSLASFWPASVVATEFEELTDAIYQMD
jgi:hypothetical protein